MLRKTFTADDAAVPMNYPLFMFRALRDDGLPVDALLAGTGLTASHLEDPNHRAPFWPVRRFIENAMRMTDDPHLGVRLARRFEPNYVGLPAYAAMNAARFEDALRVLHRFFTLTFPAIDFAFVEVDAARRPGEAAIRLRPKFDFGDIAYFAFSSALVVCEELCKGMLRAPGIAARGELAMGQPDGWAAIAPEVGFPVSFGAEEHRLLFPAALLAQALPGSDPINHAKLVALCERFASEAAFETSAASQVVAFLEAQPQFGASLAMAAGALGCSERSLRRRLHQSGVSYRKLVDRVRERRACEMLATSSRPIQEIAHDLGFDAPSNFARSFKRWTGVSPKAYRDRRAGSGGGRN